MALPLWLGPGSLGPASTGRAGEASSMISSRPAWSWASNSLSLDLLGQWFPNFKIICGVFPPKDPLRFP